MDMWPAFINATLEMVPGAATPFTSTLADSISTQRPSASNCTHLIW